MSKSKKAQPAKVIALCEHPGFAIKEHDHPPLPSPVEQLGDHTFRCTGCGHKWTRSKLPDARDEFAILNDFDCPRCKPPEAPQPE